MVYQAVSTVGYRPHVRSATIHDVVTTAPWLLPPLARARRAVLCAVEAAFGLALELGVEFSGLIGWRPGAQLGWHHDANREYLDRRHVSAVLYLNTQGADFGGGDFRFQDGPEPLRVAPRPGRLVAYTADARNVHCVERVGWGERVTLTLWFSLEPAAAEDGKVLEQLCRCPQLRMGTGSTDPLTQRGQQHAEAEAEEQCNPVWPVVESSQRRVWLGPGLPDTMFLLRQQQQQQQQPAEVQPGTSTESARQHAAQGQEPQREVCASEDRCAAAAIAAFGTAQPTEEPVDVRSQRLSELGLRAVAVSDAASAPPAAAAAGAGALGGGPARDGDGVWVCELGSGVDGGAVDKLLLRSSTHLAGSSSGRGLRFGSLTEAVMAAAFTAYRLGAPLARAASVAAAAPELRVWEQAASRAPGPEAGSEDDAGPRTGAGAPARLSLQQLSESVAWQEGAPGAGGPLQGYVAAATAQLRRQLPEWLQLGSLLGASD
ncbi:hypothetical protein HYH02_002817 [Chlamydomonas schloesseri]|uniref:Fe2OG dioxygenase domain-containing protein n=1 Tax=Chlamydomonas schloesseri TaxID=2026947 RepID=A0A835WU70_9CHLO|nr:hypothetical protein HYH02_002817 [Chlamydomonas schloesseri]|eukprot:KAG2452580.1 hypothetical protein HYH02_002817 [Chlamydomonas schloesseri]